jgi:ankyrin repeat protein
MEIIEFLHSNGAKLNELTRGRWSPLHYAVAKNQVEAASWLLDHPEVDINSMRANGTVTPVVTAITEGSKDAVELLIKRGCSFTDGNGKGRAFTKIKPHPIQTAADVNQPEILSLLIDNDAVWDTLDPHQVQGVIENVIDMDDVDAMRHFCQRLAGSPSKMRLIALWRTIAKCVQLDVEYVKSLMGLQLLAMDYVHEGDGMTFLHLVAIYGGTVDVARFFVDSGVDVNVKDASGRTALKLAVSKRNSEVADFLSGLK